MVAAVTVLDARALNRATLARQLLLRRERMPAIQAVEHLVGLQAQEPQEPYVGLWSRLAAFDPAELSGLLASRRAVRTQLMRGTLHLVSAADCQRLRPVHHAMLVARAWGALRRRLPGVAAAELAAAGRPLFEGEPRTLPEAGRELAGRWPGVAARDLGNALSSAVPLVQVPPRGLWGQRAPARNLTVEAWLGPSPAIEPDEVLDDLVLRYLTAYGPAASADLRAWCGLSGLPDVVRRLRPRLRTFRDARGRVLLDVLDGLLPDPETPAPPRFLPAFDNAVLGYDDRSRIIDREHRGLSVEGTRFLLVDGRVAGAWTVAADAGAVVLRITPLVPLAPADVDAVVAEGERLLDLHAGANAATNADTNARRRVDLLPAS
jgi:hypothetical protein